MIKRNLEYYLNMHKLMWLDMAKHIAASCSTVNVDQYKRKWCLDRDLHPYHYCFACQVAVETMCHVGDFDDYDHTFSSYFADMCTYCPLRWPGNGDENHQYFCESSYTYSDLSQLGLYVRAYNEHNLELDAIMEYNSSKCFKPFSDKFWKKQCKLCYKIAMLPINENVTKLVTESL